MREMIPVFPLILVAALTGSGALPVNTAAADLNQGYQQNWQAQGAQPAQVQSQPLQQQNPNQQPQEQQNQIPQQPVQQPYQQPVPQPMPDQAFPGGQPMVQPGQMGAGQSSCTVKVGGDRTVFTLVDTGSQQARDHVSINPDRVQKVLASPDGNWALVLFKVRGESQYGAIPVDLAKCEAQEAVDIPGVTDNAQFEGESATLVYPDGSQRKLSLRNQ